jgi:phage gp36-like protein
MSYASIEKLQKRLAQYFAQLYVSTSNASPDEDLSAAAARIDSYAGVRYKTPIIAAGSATKTVLENWNLTLAEELAWSHGSTDAIPENVKDRVKACLDELAKLSSGALILPDAAPTDAPGSGSKIAFVSGTAPAFKRNQLKGW